MTIFKKAYRKNWTLDAWSNRSDSGLLDYGRLDTRTLDDLTFGFRTTGRLDAWTLDF